MDPHTAQLRHPPTAIAGTLPVLLQRDRETLELLRELKSELCTMYRVSEKYKVLHNYFQIF